MIPVRRSYQLNYEASDVGSVAPNVTGFTAQLVSFGGAKQTFSIPRDSTWPRCDYWAIELNNNYCKGWFPYDRRRSRIADRRSQTIADDRKESCFHIIADDRKRSQSRLFSGNVKCTRALCSRENQSKQHGGQRGGNFAASKFISPFSPKATTSSASKPKETSVLDSKNIHEETRTWCFPHTCERTSCF